MTVAPPAAPVPLKDALQEHRTTDIGVSRGRGPATTLRVAPAPAVLVILWQGATAGGILLHRR